MIFDEDSLSKEEKDLINEIKNMSDIELMAFIRLGEDMLKEAIEEVTHCEESKLNDAISNMTSNVLTLRYYHSILDKRRR